MRDELFKLMGERLSRREIEILLLRYGFVDGKAWTLKKIAKLFGCSLWWICMIERGAIAKLRKHPRIEELLEYVA